MRETTFLKLALDPRGDGVVSRRGFFRRTAAGALGLAGLSFADALALGADDLRKQQRACILLWMGGGPSQMDTFDPKPDHPNGGGVKPIATAVPGVSLAPGWEKTARLLKDVAVVRSMTNREGNHQRATYQLHTGYAPTGTVKHPHLGCSVANELGDPKFDLPHVVSIGEQTTGAGLLGVGLEPFLVQNPLQPPANAVLPAHVTERRLKRRLGLMQSLEQGAFERTGGADRVRDHTSLYKQTAGMVLSPRMKAFQLDEEPAGLRDAYGRNPFGQGCLLARRLVQAGVTFVEVRSRGWDTHLNNEERVGELAAQVDPAFATLITDLKSRGMLDRTLVLWMGEFGRTPKINANAGRDHWPRVFNVALAGGGVKGGQAVGTSSPDGTEVKDAPVSVNDLLASVCHALKVNPAKENMSSLGRPIKIVDGGKVVAPLFS